MWYSISAEMNISCATHILQVCLFTFQSAIWLFLMDAYNKHLTNHFSKCSTQCENWSTAHSAIQYKIILINFLTLLIGLTKNGMDTVLHCSNTYFSQNGIRILNKVLYVLKKIYNCLISSYYYLPGESLLLTTNTFLHEIMKLT